MTDETIKPDVGRSQAKLGASSGKYDLVAIACQEKNLESLIRLANSEGGLLDDTFRATACEGYVELKLFRN